MTWSWSIFFALLVPLAVAALGYEIHNYFTRTRPKQIRRKQASQALQLWKDGQVTGGQLYRHHRGGEYLIVAIANGYCEDQVKWPITVVYCDMQFRTHYSRPLHEFLQSMTLDKTIDNSVPSPFDELMAMTVHRMDGPRNTGMPAVGSVWYCVKNYGEGQQEVNEITVKEIANKDRAQPIIVYIENKYPHDLRAMNLYQFLRVYKRKEEQSA